MLSLADAIIEERLDQISMAIQSGAGLNELDEYGFTPLIEAAIVDNLEIANFLIHHRADVNLQDMTGGTPLQWAAENNNFELCRLLLENGANPNAYNFAGQPVLVMPLLRQQTELKNLLIRYGADLVFAQDYINTKLLGHMFELVGTATIVDPKNNFVEVDFEGFFLEFSLAAIADSLAQFKNHFAGREIRRYLNLTVAIIDTLNRAAKLNKYQQYRVDIKKYQKNIRELIQQEPLIIPIGYEGHAITFIKMANIFVKCDRREDSRLFDNVMFYQINRPDVFTQEFVQKLMYDKQSGDVINDVLPQVLQLQPLTELKVAAQISGNCSWANVEACIPALYFLLFSQDENFNDNIPRYKILALDFFKQWREWNKDRTLNFCIQSFREADPIRKACKAEILAAILFQSCNSGSVVNHERAEAILTEIGTPQYDYIIRSYIRSYCFEERSLEGKNFLELLKSCGYRI